MILKSGSKYTLSFRPTSGGFNFSVNGWLHDRIAKDIGSRIHVLKVQLYGDVKVTVIVNSDYNAYGLAQDIAKSISDYEGSGFVFIRYENEIGDFENIVSPAVDVMSNVGGAMMPVLVTVGVIIYLFKFK